MKRSTKTAIILALTVTLVLQVFASAPAAASEKKDAYKAYYNLIEELHNGVGTDYVFDRFKLIYLDDDDIPELLAVDTPDDEYDNNGTNIYEVYTYSDGNAVMLGTYRSGVASAGGYRGDTKYIKKSGKIYETYISSGSGEGADIVYIMEEGEMKEVARGAFNIDGEKCEWKGKKVSESKYSVKLQKVFKLKKAKSFEDIKTISYKSMRKKLK